jgi:hypothetical protein
MSKKLNTRIFLLCLFSITLQSITTNAQDYKDIAPILIANCTSCHHNGGIAFSLTTFGEVTPMGNSIKNAVLDNHMPPWPPDPTYKNYVHERIVSAADKNTLVTWINNGMIAGDTTLAPPIPTYGATQLNGTPDLILQLPKFTSTATVDDHYYCVNVPTGLLQDRYIRAFEFIPGNAPLIHHAVITIDTTGTAVDDMTGGCFNFQGQINIGDFAPGMGPTVLPGVVPTKFGFRLKAGSKMSFQIHVPSGTNGLQDSSQLRIFFYPVNEPNIRPMFFETVLQNWNFYIPANDSIIATQKYPTSAAGIPIDVSLYGAFPHSHKTCTAILNYAYKNTDTIPLIRIPHWDFHWQGQYTFKNLVKIPATYHLFAAHKFDNTINNPNTPNPNQPVLPGTNTFDEMLFDSYLYTYYLPGDELVNIDSLLSNDPLFAPTSISQLDKTIGIVNVYPNPMNDYTSIEYSLTTSQFVSVKIFDIQGVEIKQLNARIEAPGYHRHIWDGTNEASTQLPSGTYIYQIQAGQKKVSGKVILK